MFKRSSRVLIIDDMAAIRKILRKALEFHGFQDIAEARDGASGWQAIEEAKQPFDFIICDWEMPGSTGFDFLKRVSTRANMVNIPVIVLLMENETESVAPAIKAGASGILIKPFTNDSVLNCLKATFKKVSGAA